MANPPRSRKAASRIDDVVARRDSSLGPLWRHARELARLDDILAGLTDPDTARHVQVANRREDRLILLAPSAAWATRLRMQAPQLLEGLRRAGLDTIRHIDIRVAPLVRSSAPQKVRRPLSPAATEALDQMHHLVRRRR
ncbi:DUF721 domain-containing protein [Elongatibacter sediminis]|uniref:DUF721 domain-containing protein n=1 Tax=Elongatibacter sediminis TaxID=3119006 RepID=A0AAW9RPX4_9GAMM